MRKITPFLWFDDKAEEAMKFYTSIFKNSKVKSVIRYESSSREIEPRDAGDASNEQDRHSGPQRGIWQKVIRQGFF